MKVSGAAACLALLQPSGLLKTAVANAKPRTQSNMAMLVDVSKCIGCWWCFAACKNCHDMPECYKPCPENPPELDAHTWTTLFTSAASGDGWDFRKHACMHCTDANCVQACPTGAISQQGGAVVINQDWCVGCGYCIQACPFGAPHKDEEVGTARKCDFCVDRVSNGEKPACAEACPTGAIQFGKRTELITVAKAKVEALKADDHPAANLYGEHELGGLHVLYILDDRPTSYGLPESPQVNSATAVSKWIGGMVTAAVLAVMPLWLIFKQKNNAEVEKQTREEGDAK